MSLDSDYKLFGLAPGSAVEELKKAYRDLVKVWHPDRFGGNPPLQRKAQEKLKQVNLAYERLQLRLTPAASANTRGGRSTAERSRATPPPPRPPTAPGTTRSRSGDRPGAPVERIRASRPAWFVLAGLLALVLVSSLPSERPKTPESGRSGVTPASKPEMEPEVRDVSKTPTPEPRPSGGVKVKPGSEPLTIRRPEPESKPLPTQQPDCPGPGVHRMIAKDGAVLFVNCPPKERVEGP
jgi:DnaJ domain